MQLTSFNTPPFSDKKTELQGKLKVTQEVQEFGLDLEQADHLSVLLVIVLLVLGKGHSGMKSKPLRCDFYYWELSGSPTKEIRAFGEGESWFSKC